MWWKDVCYIGIVCGPTGPERGTRGAAERNCAKMIVIESPFVDDIFLKERHVLLWFKSGECIGQKR